MVPVHGVSQRWHDDSISFSLMVKLIGGSIDLQLLQIVCVDLEFANSQPGPTWLIQHSIHRRMWVFVITSKQGQLTHSMKSTWNHSDINRFSSSMAQLNGDTIKCLFDDPAVCSRSIQLDCDGIRSDGPRWGTWHSMMTIPPISS